MIEEPEEPEGGDDEDVDDEPTESRQMGQRTLMLGIEEQRAETERLRIKAEAEKAVADSENEVELARIAADERKAEGRRRLIIAAIVLALLGGAMGLWVNLDVFTGKIEVSPTAPTEERSP